MTRWARANNREGRPERQNDAPAEEATPWSVMVQSLHASRQRQQNPEEIEEDEITSTDKRTQQPVQEQVPTVTEADKSSETDTLENLLNETNNSEKSQPLETSIGELDKLARRILRNERKRKLSSSKNAEAPPRSKDKNNKDYYFNEELETRYRVYHPYLSIGKFAGYQVLATGAKRLRNLTKTLRKKGMSEEEVQEILKLERRKEEHKLRRAKNKVCLCCRDIGHTVSQCPKVAADGEAGYGICFRCGSTEHAARKCKAKLAEGEPEFPYAKCYICGEMGHLAQACSKNTKGVYPRGGSCHRCGSIEHLKGQCPTNTRSQINTDDSIEEDGSISLAMTGVSQGETVEQLEEEI